LRQKGVIKELKIDEPTMKKVNDLLDKIQDRMRIEINGGGDQAELEKQIKEQIEGAERDGKKELQADLSADQYKRFDELNLQSLGVEAFRNEDVRTKLAFGDDQKKKVDLIIDKADEATQSLYAAHATPDANGQVTLRLDKDDEKKLQDLMAKSSAQVQALLTDDQKAKWAAMVGAKFKFDDPA
jgi:hypothetical protein